MCVGLLAQAMAQALAASQLSPSDPRLLYNLGLLHRQMAMQHGQGPLREREEALAVSSFEQALRHDPNLHQALASLGHMAGRRDHHYYQHPMITDACHHCSTPSSSMEGPAASYLLSNLLVTAAWGAPAAL